MGRKSKQILQRRHKDGLKAHEKMFNIANYQRNVNQNYNEVAPHTGQSGHQKSIQTINAGEGVEKKRNGNTPTLIDQQKSNLNNQTNLAFHSMYLTNKKDIEAI